MRLIFRPEFRGIQTYTYKAAFHDTDTEILADILTRIVARMSAFPRSACHRNNSRKSRVSDVSASILARKSVSWWNSAYARYTAAVIMLVCVSDELRVPQAHDARPVEGAEDSKDAEAGQLLPTRLQQGRVALLGSSHRPSWSRQPRRRRGRRRRRRRRQRTLRQCQALRHCPNSPSPSVCVRVNEYMLCTKWPRTKISRFIRPPFMHYILDPSRQLVTSLWTSMTRQTVKTYVTHVTCYVWLTKM